MPGESARHVGFWARVAASAVDTETGAPATFPQWIVRYLGYFASILPLDVGLLWVAFDRKKQVWHDKLAGTVVIRADRRKGLQLGCWFRNEDARAIGANDE